MESDKADAEIEAKEEASAAEETLSEEEKGRGSVCREGGVEEGGP